MQQHHLKNKKHNFEQNKIFIMFIGKIKQTFILIFKKHQNITDANSKEEFSRRRSSLKVKPGERVEESIEDAPCDEKREKRKFFAGTFGSGVETINETKCFH